MRSGVAAANAASSATDAARQAAQKHEQRAQAIVDSANGAILNFETAVVDRTDRTVLALVNDATLRVNQASNTSSEALEQRAGEILTEITEKGQLER